MECFLGIGGEIWGMGMRDVGRGRAIEKRGKDKWKR
jgi:hypothetical protein